MNITDCIAWVAVHLGILVLMLVASAGTGHIFLRRLAFHSTVERLIFTTALGLGLFALIVFTLGLSGLLYRSVVWALTGAGATGTILYLAAPRNRVSTSRVKLWKEYIASRGKLSLLIASGVAAYWAALLPCTQYPPLHWDAISHHLVLSREYLEQHRIVAVMGINFPVLPSLNHMLFSWALALKDDVLAQMVEHTFLLLTAAGLYCWGSREKRPALGLAMAGFWLGSPLVQWLGEAAYVDVCLTSFVFLGLYALRLFWGSRRPGWWYLSVALLAMAAGVKAPGLFFLIAGGAFGLWAYLRWRLISGTKRADDAEANGREAAFLLRPLLLGWALGAVVALPWYLFIFYQTGNPLWPAFAEYSEGIWGSPEVVRNINAWLGKSGEFRTLGSFLTLSFDWINDPARFEAENGVTFFPLMVAWPVAWVFALWNRSVRWWALWALAYTLFWFQHPHQLRFWLPAFPLAIIALSESIRSMIESAWESVRFHRVFWVALACAAFAWGGRSLASELRHKRLPPTDQARREAFLTGLPGYGAARYVNQHADKQDIVCVINASYLNYYLEPRKLDLFTLLYAPGLPRFRWPDDAAWVRWLASQNARWILIKHANAPDYLRLPKQNLVTNPYWPDYELVYSDAIAWVFRYEPEEAEGISGMPEELPVYEGYHDITNCNGIMGWAWDKNRPDEPVNVDIYDGDTLLFTLTANEFRQDLADAGIGNGRHGFTYTVPPGLKDGKPHLIRMRIAGTSIELLNTPRVLNCEAEQ